MSDFILKNIVKMLWTNLIRNSFTIFFKFDNHLPHFDRQPLQPLLHQVSPNHMKYQK